MYSEIELLAKEAGKIMLEASIASAGIHEKSSGADIVTEYDVRIQNFLTESLAELFPEARFMGEEDVEKKDPCDILKGTAFIIDPIDGTTNFVKDYYKSAVSIALARDGEVEYGCCYIPYSDELFYAEKGKGAYRNGSPIRCSSADIAHSIAAVGTSPYLKKEFGEATFGIMKTLFYYAMDVRRFGSAVIDLLDVACGKTGIFCELRLSPWDYAAAGLIAREAGAIVTDMNGKKPGLNKKHSILAGCSACHEFFLNCNEVMKYKDLF